MDTIRIAGAQSPIVADQPLARIDAQERTSPEVRILAEWELVLAAGGESLPEWQ